MEEIIKAEREQVHRYEARAEAFRALFPNQTNIFDKLAAATKYKISLLEELEEVTIPQFKEFGRRVARDLGYDLPW